MLAATISDTAVRKIVVYQMFKPSSSKVPERAGIRRVPGQLRIRDADHGNRWLITSRHPEGYLVLRGPGTVAAASFQRRLPQWSDEHARHNRYHAVGGYACRLHA